MDWPTWTICIAGAYLTGSIPFGVLIGRLRGVDVLGEGSGNPGATNVARLLGRGWGLVCFGLDVAKGAAPVIVAGLLTGTLGRDVADLQQGRMWWWLGVAFAAITGHTASIFLRFGGGKGVATGFGTMVAMWPLLTLPALGAMVIWYGTLRLTRYVSVSSMAAAASLPVGYVLTVLPRDALEQPWSHTWSALTHAWPPLLVTALLAVMVVWRHRANIGRLRRGEEPKAGGRRRRGDLLETD